MNSFKDKINSFKGYDRVTAEQERLQYRKKARKRFAIIAISSLLLIIIIVAAVVGTAASRKKDSSSSTSSNMMSQTDAIKAVCSVTQDPSTCFTSLSLAADPGTVDPKQLFQLSMKIALRELSNVSALPGLLAAKENNTMIKKVLEDCQETIDTAIDLLNSSITATQKNAGGDIPSQDKVDDLKTWLSSVLTNMETCLDGFDELTSASKEKEMMQLALRNSTLLTSNSLAIANKIITILQHFNIPLHRRLLGFPSKPSSDGATGFPAWVSSKDRKLLQDNSSTISFDIVVAQDGTGNERSIAEAINKVPLQSTKRFVIRVKAGKYIENVVIDKKRQNVMLIGDGMGATIISGSLSFGGGSTTFRSATFAVTGSGFMAKDIGFENTAGPEKHQAVAVRVGSDHAVFYNCRFDGYQDTLYAHSNRQFYRGCTISGTIDFIFGNAAVVFQSCNILVRQPMTNQQNTVTAQGRTDCGQNTGISVLGCQIAADKTVTAPTYLGRPWKPCAVTVIMKTEIGGLVSPAGWLEWVPKTPPAATIFYGEYQNTGAGAGIGQRVNWTGYYPAIDDAMAEKYTVGSFIQGGEWLSDTGVQFTLGL
ncbi:pectinesterase-like [Nymphaea colorata]|nr:pectinesterase-like [Nymphaea colorata]